MCIQIRNSLDTPMWTRLMSQNKGHNDTVWGGGMIPVVSSSSAIVPDKTKKCDMRTRTTVTPTTNCTCSSQFAVSVATYSVSDGLCT